MTGRTSVGVIEHNAQWGMRNGENAPCNVQHGENDEEEQKGAGREKRAGRGPTDSA